MCVGIEVALYVRAAATKVIFSQAYLVYSCPHHYREMDMGGGLGELVDFQGSPCASSRMVHLHMQEGKQRWQEAHMHEQGAPDKTKT